MIFEWDEGKRNANLVRHGIDFLDAALLFDGRPVFTAPSPFEGEERFLTVGTLDTRFMTTVWDMARRCHPDHFGEEIEKR